MTYSTAWRILSLAHLLRHHQWQYRQKSWDRINSADCWVGLCINCLEFIHIILSLDLVFD
jgi:hypothetical protein